MKYKFKLIKIKEGNKIKVYVNALTVVKILKDVSKILELTKTDLENLRKFEHFLNEEEK